MEAVLTFWILIKEWLIEIFSKLSAPPVPKEEKPTGDLLKFPSWYAIAKAEIGVAEFPGEKKNPKISDYHKKANFKAGDEDDSWCSSFACYCMEMAGIPSTKNASARSWLEWGHEIKTPVVGCVVVFWRETKDSWKGHVGFFAGEKDGEILVLGGNQDNAVKIKGYPKSRLLGFRMPKGF
jgi:uncharacterized protein (TIGR02594 family)